MPSPRVAALFLAVAASTPAEAEQLAQETCTSLAKVVSAYAELAGRTEHVVDSVRAESEEQHLGPNTAAAVRRLSDSRERLRRAIREYIASSKDAAQRLGSCAD